MRALLVVSLLAACTPKTGEPEPPPGYPKTPEAVLLAYHQANNAQDFTRARSFMRHVDALAQDAALQANKAPPMPDLSAHVSLEVLNVTAQPAFTLVSAREKRPGPAVLVGLLREKRIADPTRPPSAIFEEAAKEFGARIAAGDVEIRSFQRTYRVVKEDGAWKVVLFLAERERANQLLLAANALRAKGDNAGAAKLDKEREDVLKQIPAEAQR